MKIDYKQTARKCQAPFQVSTFVELILVKGDSKETNVYKISVVTNAIKKKEAGWENGEWRRGGHVLKKVIRAAFSTKIVFGSAK